MEEKVAYTLKLIEEDGDSFAKRAEMYYKKRPELIIFVEESYRGYRALAERYDHLSTELQNANNTIASVFPEKMPYSVEDEDEDTAPKTQPRAHKGNIPKVPKIPAKEVKTFSSSPSKKLRPSKSTKRPVVKSGLSKSEGVEEIDKLQKQILALQTEREFVKSAYESRLAKYWEIENQMKEVQEKVCNLQDEFGTGIEIETDNARTLMAASALKSCQDTMAQLQVKQERSAEEVKMEWQRINKAKEKLESLKGEFVGDETTQKKASKKDGDSSKEVKQGLEGKSEQNKLELLQEKIENTEFLSATEMAEKIDEVVTQVVSLENEVLSQTSLIERLRQENDKLQSQIRSLEDDTVTLVNGKNDLSNKVVELEGKLHGLQLFSQDVEEKNNNLQTHFTEANSSLGKLSGKLQHVKPDEEIEGLLKEEEKCPAEVHKEIEGRDDAVNPTDDTKQLKSEKSIKGVEATNLAETSKPDEEPNVSHSLQKEEKITTEVKSAEDSKEEENISNHSDDEEKNLDTTKKHDPSANPEIQEGAVIQASENNDHSEQITQENVDKQKEKSQEQEAQWDANHGNVQEKDINTTKEHDSSVTPKIQGSTAIQTLEKNDSAKQINQGNVDKQEEKSQEQEAQSCANHGNVCEKTTKEVQGGAAIEPIEKNDSADQFAQDNFDKQEEKSQEQEAQSNSNHVDNVSEKAKEGYSETKDNPKQQVQFPCPKSQGKVATVSGFDTEDTSCKEDNNNTLGIGRNAGAMAEETGEPNWKEMFMKGMENKEKILLKEYTSILRNYKDLKKKMKESPTEMNAEGKNSSSDVDAQLKELKVANAKKDEEIKSLLQKLGNLQTCFGDKNNVEAQLAERNLTMTKASTSEPAEGDIDDRLLQAGQSQDNISEIEEKFRMGLDELLEENLDFWLRFSASFHQVQKFETEVQDLQAEVKRLEDKHKKQEGSNSMKYSLRSDGRPLYKHLTEIQNELSVWMEKCALLKDELKSRFSSLCNIQEEITMALRVSAEDDDFTFTSHQAAKFQGEVLNMKQENNKVADELQAGLDHVTNLQLEVEKSLNVLSEKFGLSDKKTHLEHSSSKGRVPLQSFIFGTKPKKRASFLSCVHPALHRKYNGLRSGLR